MTNIQTVAKPAYVGMSKKEKKDIETKQIYFNTLIYAKAQNWSCIIAEATKLIERGYKLPFAYEIRGTAYANRSKTPFAKPDDRSNASEDLKKFADIHNFSDNIPELQILHPLPKLQVRHA